MKIQETRWTWKIRDRVALPQLLAPTIRGFRTFTLCLDRKKRACASRVENFIARVISIKQSNGGTILLGLCNDVWHIIINATRCPLGVADLLSDY